jgi:diphosphomevalonate decarboxylase
MTLDTLYTEMAVELAPELPCDELTVNGLKDTAMLPRVSACLDTVAGVERARARVTSRCNFPLAAGLASSASAFAALVVAAAAASGRRESCSGLANLAGRASGSAARSLYGGFAELTNKTDSVSVSTIADAADWPLRVVIAVTAAGAKPVGSGTAMETSRKTSVFYQRWLDGQPADLGLARTAIRKRDFAALARASEHNCLKMHSVMWASRPATIFWNPATLNCLETIRSLQREGTEVFFTIDAGPQVKAVCTPLAESIVRQELQNTAGVQDVLASGLGDGAILVGGG